MEPCSAASCSNEEDDWALRPHRRRPIGHEGCHCHGTSLRLAGANRVGAIQYSRSRPSNPIVRKYREARPFRLGSKTQIERLSVRSTPQIALPGSPAPIRGFVNLYKWQPAEKSTAPRQALPVVLGQPHRATPCHSRAHTGRWYAGVGCGIEAARGSSALMQRGWSSPISVRFRALDLRQAPSRWDVALRGEDAARPSN